MQSIYKWVSEWDSNRGNIISYGTPLFYLLTIFATVLAPKGFLRTTVIQFVIITVLSFLSYAISIKLEDWEISYELTKAKKILFMSVFIGCVITIVLHILINGINVFDLLNLVQFAAVVFNSCMLGIDVHTALVHNPVSEGRVKRAFSVIVFGFINLFAQVFTIIAGGISKEVIGFFVLWYLITMVANGLFFFSGLIKFLLDNIRINHSNKFKSEEVRL